MNKQMMQGFWESFRLHTGVSLRAIAMIPEDKLDAQPVADMRTPKELAVHAFAYVRGIPAGVMKGSLTAEDCTEPVDQIKSRDDLVKWCRESWEIADRDFEKLNDGQLSAQVQTHFGQPFPGWMLLTITYDEHIHHRGQLYTFLRAMGVEPPFLWSFEENDAKFRPKAPTA
jgi:uncharacterized damage-inducible protein DinB